LAFLAGAFLAAAFTLFLAVFFAFLAGRLADFFAVFLDFFAGDFLAFTALDAFLAFFFFFAAMSFTPWFFCLTEKLYASSRQCASVCFVPD
jgi:succinate-acetate transporter protein